MYSVVIFKLKSKKHHRDFLDDYLNPLIDNVKSDKEYSWRIFYDDSITEEKSIVKKFMQFKNNNQVQLIHYDFPQFKK